MSECVLSVELSAGYEQQAVIRNLSFDLHRGERLGLLGPSGAGKSTLLLAMLGLLRFRGGWTRGRVCVQGRYLLAMPQREARRLRGRAIALVPQAPLSALNPALSLKRHFEHCWRAHRATGWLELQQRLHILFESVQLPADAAFLKRRPAEISVGQAQRCVLALALLHRPAILIADEITSSLDPLTQTEILQLLHEATENDGTALLFVSHDLLSVLRLCSEVAVLADGRLAERLPVQDIVDARNHTLRKLLSALPVPAEVLLQHTDQRRKAQPAGATRHHAELPETATV